MFTVRGPPARSIVHACFFQVCEQNVPAVPFSLVNTKAVLLQSVQMALHVEWNGVTVQQRPFQLRGISPRE